MMDPHQAPISATPPSSRKRSRENETESQRNKREKAAERQRRKRERDRQAGLNNLLSMSQVQQSAPPPPEEPLPSPEEPTFNPTQQKAGEELSPDEAARRDKVRSAARERQRKHRALMKQKKLRELGLDMGNELMPGMEEVQYRLSADGQYQPIMHDIQQHPHAQHPHMHEPPFPQGQPLGGQTFASTLLLSFSCAPLLKAHLLRTLNMSNEELASLEPIIAQAWDHWDQQVCVTCLCPVYISSDPLFTAATNTLRATKRGSSGRGPETPRGRTCTRRVGAPVYSYKRSCR